MKIGIVGLGSVGTAAYDGLNHYWKGNVYGYDIDGRGDYTDILDSDIVLICVSTDEAEDGRLDMTNTLDVLNKLHENEYKGLVVMKSTVQLGFFDGIKGKYDLRLCYAPEFLRERSAFKFFVYPDRLVFGFPDGDYSEEDEYILETTFNWCQCPTFYMSTTEAEIMKLAHNAKIATDVSFTNEIKMLCTDMKCDPKIVMESIYTDRRRTRHWLNPEGGPYGGKCVPKDTKDLMIATQSNFFKAVEETNERVKKRHKEGTLTFDNYNA